MVPARSTLLQADAIAKGCGLLTKWSCTLTADRDWCAETGWPVR